MKHFTVSVVIDAPAERVWTLLAEFARWPQWGPSIRAVETATERVAPGAVGRVKTAAGFWLPFEITAVEPGRAWDWKVAKIPATGHAVIPLGPTRSRATFSAPWLVAPYMLVLRVGLGRVRRLAEEAP